MSKIILGISDSDDSCSCCGRTGLKSVVWIEDSETGEIAHFGSVCATKSSGILFKDIKGITSKQSIKLEEELRVEYRSSLAYSDYQKAIDYLNSKVDLCNFKERVEYLKPFDVAKGKAYREILKKYQRAISYCPNFRLSMI